MTVQLLSTNERIRGRELQEIRRRFFYQHPLCVMCQAEGKVRIATELDHVVALINGGTDTHDNRQGLCAEHHRKKSAKDLGTKYRPAIGPDGWPARDTKVERSLSDEAQQRRMPTDLQPSAIPLTIVCGPPASGKSTYLREHAQAGDIIIDLDAIMQRISGLPEHHTDAKHLAPALTERNRQLRALATQRKAPRAWFIVSAPDTKERQQWASMLRADVVVLSTPLDECIRRINADPARRGHTERMIHAAETWWEMNRGRDG